jgi:hypothetical protein
VIPEVTVDVVEGTYVPWNVAALAWLFFPGGSTNIDLRDPGFRQASQPLRVALLQFEQVIKAQDPAVVAAMEDIRTKITDLTRLDGRLGARWGYSGHVTPELVSKISNLP